ncbi:ArsR/SmtB family transcription factor [Rubeoparvulum massiliense]|uniref:ArsR/SmtB family transcription factor n=1 Tax=Rubeoparvulum massiliense TaxID=1631346 RepID=UPI000A6C7782|nr:metalloregulator ArsR/SmtB family transcription factor [Rubeoparvulum massiliense]
MMVVEQRMNEAKLNQLAPVVKLLGDKTRLQILHLLRQREYCVCELVPRFQMSQPAISQHLRKLKDLEIVQERRNGQWIHYSLNPESSFYHLVCHILEELDEGGVESKE